MPDVFPVGETAEVGIAGRVLDRRGMDAVVVARVHLPDDAVRPEQAGQRRDVQHRLERPGHHVVAQQPRAVVDVERGGPGGAEVPAFSAGPGERTAGVEERPDLGDLAGRLVVAEQRGAGAAGVHVQADEDQHRVAAGVVVDVAPIGGADVVDAIGSAAAVAVVGQADALRQVGHRKRELAARRQQRLDLRGRQQRTDVDAGAELDESDGRLGADGRGLADERDECEQRTDEQPDDRGVPAPGSHTSPLAEDVVSRARGSILPVVARLSGLSPDPWLCGPASRRGCPCLGRFFSPRGMGASGVPNGSLSSVPRKG